MGRLFNWLLVVLLFFSACNCDPTNALKDVGANNVIWSYSIPERFLDFVQPIIENGKAFIASDTTVTCVELKSGNKLWRINFGNKSDFAARTILNSQNYLFLNHVGNVNCIDKNSGSFIWQAVMPNFDPVDLSTMSMNQTHLFVGGIGKVARISKSNGAVDLSIGLDSLKPSSVAQSSSFPLVSTDNLLYIPTGYYYPPSKATEGNMFCYNAQTGEYVWGYHLAARKVWLPALNDSVPSDAASYACALKDSLIVFGSGQYLIALNRFNGNKIWESFIPDGGFDMPPAIEYESVYIGSNNQYVYSFHLRTGQLQWKTKTRGGVTTIFTVQGNRVYLCNELGGEIWVLNAINGSVVWNSFPPEYETDRYATFSSPIAVGEGYMVNVGSKRVYCLKDP